METDLDELLRKGKIKRIFRAKRKITSPDLVSHITQRAAGKEPLFLDDNDYLLMLSNLKEVAAKRSLDVYAFCLMPNHVHLLLRPLNHELHEAMRDLFSRYAMMFNKKYERKGHLFCGPYRQAVCLDDSYLLAASLYIHMNPVRASLVEDPRRYRWSSVQLYCVSNQISSFIKASFVLRLLAKGEKRGKEMYSKLLDEAVKLDLGDVLEQKEAVNKFCKHLVRRFPGVFSRLKKRKQITRITGLEMLEDAEIERVIRQMRNRKNRITPEGRKACKFLIEQLVARGYKRKEIAENLGVSVKTVYNILNAES